VAWLQIGRMTQGPERRDALFQATYVDHIRLEAFYELMCDEAKNDHHGRAVGWALAAPNLRTLQPYMMFAEKELYEWKFDYQACISAWYAAGYVSGECYQQLSMFHFGRECCLRSLVKCPEAEGFRQAVVNNLALYEKKIGQCYRETSLLEDKSNTIPPAYEERASSKTVSAPAVESSIPRYLEPPPQVIIRDNFFSDPYEARAIGLNLPMTNTGNYPGTRTNPFFFPGIKERFEAILGSPGCISYWPTDKNNGCFQLTMAHHKSWIHRDLTDFSVVVYLTPPPVPVNSGTVIYRHRASGLSRTYENQDLENLLNQDSHNPDAWDELSSIGNIFNRAVIFNGRYSHISGEYFGTNKDNGRLFQTFFFDVKK
jgi:hypothetical protein